MSRRRAPDDVSENEAEGAVNQVDAPDRDRRKTVLLRNRDFRMVWAGESVSLLGSEISVVALPSLVVLVFGEGAFAVGVVVALQWLPFMFLAPILGVVTDRVHRRLLMQVANVARFLILGSLPLAWAFDELTIGHLYAAALLKGVFDVVFQLAYQAYLPQLLDREDLADGNAKTQLSQSLALVLGRSSGGGLVSLVGATRSIVVDAATYLVSSVALLQVRSEEPAPASSGRGVRSILLDLRGGAKLTFGNRLLRYLTLMATFGNTAVSLTLAMIIVFAYEDLDFSGGQVGLALGLGGVGVMVGALLARQVNERLGMGPTLIFTHTVLGFAFLLLPVATLSGSGIAFVVIVVSQCVSSFTTPIANVAIMTLLQKTTPTEAMGRVGGVALPFVFGARGVGPIVGSAVATFSATSNAFFLAAALAFMSVAWIIIGSVHHLHSEVPENLRVQV